MKNKRITLGFSPCPNDTFIFDAMVHKRIDTEGLTFDYKLDDVEALNQRAFDQEFDVTKVSFHAFLHMMSAYQLLSAGAAFGEGVGPLLIHKNLPEGQDISRIKVAIPGEYTTANLLLSLYAPKCSNRIPMLFSDIERALLADEVEAGLVIHETRFTYRERGLKLLVDLGTWWFQQTSLPVPLGGIAVKREFDQALKVKINRVLKRSVAFAMAHPEFSLPFISSNAQELSADVTKKHIQTYVNSFSLDIGAVGQAAVQRMVDEAVGCGLISSTSNAIFIDL